MDKFNLDMTLEDVGFSQKSTIEVIDYIIDNHHVYVKDILKEIDKLVFLILKVHFHDNREELLKVHKLFGRLKTELESHLIKKEENLFPLILSYEESKDEASFMSLKKFVSDTEDEQDLAIDIFKELELITRDYTNPSGTCITFKKTYQLIADLQKETFKHIQLENAILFKSYR